MAKKLERVVRTRKLTVEEIARDREIREKIEKEFPPARFRPDAPAPFERSAEESHPPERKVGLSDCQRSGSLADRHLAVPLRRSRHPPCHGRQAGRDARPCRADGLKWGKRPRSRRTGCRPVMASPPSLHRRASCSSLRTPGFAHGDHNFPGIDSLLIRPHVAMSGLRQSERITLTSCRMGFSPSPNESRRAKAHPTREL